MVLDTLLLLMPNQPDIQVALVNAKGRFGFGQLFWHFLRKTRCGGQKNVAISMRF